MPELISTKKGFANAVIEPQFQQFGTRTIVTLQFSEYEEARAVRRHFFGTSLSPECGQIPFGKQLRSNLRGSVAESELNLTCLLTNLKWHQKH
jgi:hypothetical protein